ncbi:MAG: hypothetical protein IJ074_11320 [Clostridia bacterium]|nr:hypothetical protein [Clostridia bacterium]
MKLRLDAQKLSALKNYLEASEDAEALTAREYVADFYDAEAPFSVDLSFGKDCVYVDGAAYLRYDEAQDGWYIAERILDEDTLLALLEKSGAFAP